MAEKKYEERDQFPTLIDGGQVDEAIVNTPPTEKGVFNTGITSTQIEQVVDLPVPTTDDEGKVLKVDAEGKWELSTDAEGTVVVANPTLAGTEADLVGLQVGATKYKVPEGMQVLELSSNSGTLTDEQYALASGNKCIVKYGITFLHKNKETGSNIKYDSFIEEHDTPPQFLQNYELTIYKSDKSFAINSLTVVYPNPALAGTESALTSLQVGNTKYKVGGAESPIAYEGTSLLPEGVVFENWTLHRAIQDGNVLWLVCAGNINNTTAEAVSITNIFEVSISSTIASKIYRADGSTCNNSYTVNGAITSFVGARDNAQQVFRLNSNEANKLLLILNGSYSISANYSVRIDFRFPIFLDIGTVAS